MDEYTVRIVGTCVVVWSYHANVACRDVSVRRGSATMEKCELDDLSDSDDELWLICFVLLSDIHVFCIVFSMDPLRSEIKLYYCYYYY